MSTEVETLRARREALKEELQVEGQKRKSLREAIEILNELIIIRGLERELDAERDSVKQLESWRSELQDIWNQSAQDTGNVVESQESSSEQVVAEMPGQISEPVESEESDAQKKRRWI